MLSLEDKAREFFKQNPKINQVSKNKGPGYRVDGIHIITTDWGLNERTLSSADKAWLVEKDFNEFEFLELKKSVRHFFLGEKNFDVKRSNGE